MSRQYELAALRANASNLQMEARIRDRLVELWQVGGLSLNEARSVVASRQFNPSLEAVLESVRRTGSDQGLRDTWAAYHSRNYPLANDLLFCSWIVLNEEIKASDTAKARDDEVTRAKADLDALGLRWEASDPAYRRKLDYLEPELKKIIATYPPNEWARRVERAYSEVRL